MLRHDPYEPMVRTEMAARWQQAERARLRRETHAHRGPSEDAQEAVFHRIGWWRRLARLLGGTVAAPLEG